MGNPSVDVLSMERTIRGYCNCLNVKTLIGWLQTRDTDIYISVPSLLSLPFTVTQVRIIVSQLKKWDERIILQHKNS